MKENRIAEFLEVKMMHPMLAPTFKFSRGAFKQAKHFPQVTHALLSKESTGIGTDRAHGACHWYADRYQKPLFRDPNIRLQFPRLQGNVVDVAQNPPSLYTHAQKTSHRLVL